MKTTPSMIAQCFTLCCLALLLCMAGPTWQAAASTDVRLAGGGVAFSRPAAMEGYGLHLTLSGPDAYVAEAIFGPAAALLLAPAGELPDGHYRYELQPLPPARDRERGGSVGAAANVTATGTDGRGDWDGPPFRIQAATELPPTEEGVFLLQNGVASIPADTPEPTPKGASNEYGRTQARDNLVYDDQIITGSLCVGFWCADGLAFGYDTTILKEHNLRLFFDDTSDAPGYSKNDWRIVINDTTSGGASYFAVQDATSSTTPFKVEADAPNNALYVEDYGRVGFGTSTPVTELHIKASDTPTVRLEQDTSGGWSAQTFDIAANETSFFIRDATNGSTLPFRIRPGAPSNTLVVKDGDSSGYVGINVLSPTAELHVKGDAYINGDLQIASSRALKQDITPLEGREALDLFARLHPVSFRYKAAPEEPQLGFIAEDVPALMARTDRKGLNPMDFTALLTRVVQEQQQTILAQREELQALEARLAALESRVGE